MIRMGLGTAALCPSNPVLKLGASPVDLQQNKGRWKCHVSE